MEKENNKAPLVDDLLQAVEGLQEAQTDAFFYTRLRAKMEREREREGWSLPLRPAWVIGCLALLLAVNSTVAFQQFTGRKQAAPSAATIESFATSYNQTINSDY